jgi:hypothetical protein
MPLLRASGRAAVSFFGFNFKSSVNSSNGSYDLLDQPFSFTICAFFCALITSSAVSNACAWS